jgi:hypothetical protein
MNNGGGCSGGSRKRGRKMRGGNFYGMAGSIGTAGALYEAVPNSGANSATGQLTPELYGGRRRRSRSRKASRRRRARRGGNEGEPADTSPSGTSPSAPATPPFTGVGTAATTGTTGTTGTTEDTIRSSSALHSETSDTSGGRRRRHRKSKKAKKTRNSRRKTRKMRGGMSYLPATNVSVGFIGNGSRGMADYANVGTGMPNDVVPSS